MSKKRVGRGNSSKIGNTCGRGYKGQKSRSGYSKKKFFIGGQTPYNILFPKFGFKKNKKIKKITKNIFYFTFFYNKKIKILYNNYLIKKTFFYINICSKMFKKKIENIGGYVYEIHNRL
ncbi:hypothetical protein [Candidatus Vidania fulgoroideorum]